MRPACQSLPQRDARRCCRRRRQHTTLDTNLAVKEAEGKRRKRAERQETGEERWRKKAGTWSLKSVLGRHIRHDYCKSSTAPKPGSIRKGAGDFHIAKQVTAQIKHAPPPASGIAFTAERNDARVARARTMRANRGIATVPTGVSVVVDVLKPPSLDVTDILSCAPEPQSISLKRSMPHRRRLFASARRRQCISVVHKTFRRHLR